ncbi:MAG TPA: hypothetical protein P5560_03675 [Thermotogota bacterium]|nr:hypothetical protein [Thermotogota bacterium]HRW92029.1 hypothetical protein [Thermotogota bacterium]
MKGDVILVEEHHRNAAQRIVGHFLHEIQATKGKFAFSVAGESGSGKSETAMALQEELGSKGIASYVFQQDDYFVLPPKSNDARRRKELHWVGTQEVRLDLLDSHLSQALEGCLFLSKPLVLYEEDRISEEKANLEGVKVLIAEGTYTTLLQHVNRRVFINRNRLETMQSRKRRGREPMDPFLEKVLEIEHQIISRHRERSDVVINNDYSVEFVH